MVLLTVLFNCGIKIVDTKSPYQLCSCCTIDWAS